MYEFIASGLRPSSLLDNYLKVSEARQNSEINAVNIDAARTRNATADLALKSAQKQITAEDTWAKLPRSEDGALDPQAEQQFKVQFPEYYDTRKKAEVSQFRDQLGMSADKLNMASVLFSNVHSDEDVTKAQSFAKETLGIDVPHDSAVFGKVQPYLSDLAKTNALIQDDIAAAAANGDWETVKSLKSSMAAETKLAQLKVQTALSEAQKNQAAANASNASAYKYYQQGKAAAAGPAGKPLTVTQEIAVTKEQERIDKREQKKALLIASTDETIDTIKDAIKGVGFTSSGVTGKVMGAVPGNDTYDQNNRITTIKANIGFDRLQAMRDASPTGGALGQVAIQELVALQASIASLDIGQNEATQKKNLNKVLKHYENWKRTITGESALKDSGSKKADAPREINFSDLPK